jgi:hypothetical protein
MLDIHLVQRTDYCWALKIKCADTVVFAASLAALKAEIATPCRKFDFAARCWVIIADGSECLERYLSLMEARFAASIRIRDETNDERTERERQTRHESAAGGGAREETGSQRDKETTKKMNILRAYETLYLQPGAPMAVIHAAYRTLAKLHHPDMGGDTTAMAEINTAYHHVLASLNADAA